MIKERPPIKMSGLCLAGQPVFDFLVQNTNVSANAWKKYSGIHFIAVALDPAWNGQNIPLIRVDFAEQILLLLFVGIRTVL